MDIGFVGAVVMVEVNGFEFWSAGVWRIVLVKYWLELIHFGRIKSTLYLPQSSSVSVCNDNTCVEWRRGVLR